MTFDDIRLYLPQYLSSQSEEDLFADVTNFTNQHRGQRFYGSAFRDETSIYQGDCIAGLPMIELPATVSKPANVLVISNSCDISPRNARYFSASVCYCPILDFEKYLNTIRDAGIDREKVEHHADQIRRQRVTQILHLPADNDLPRDAIAFLDRICYIPVDTLSSFQPIENRFLSLGNFGFYLLLLKLSIHFMRIRESVDRV